MSMDLGAMKESMKLTQLLNLHYKFKAGSLTEVFGDGFLLEHNRIYRGIRQQVLDRSFSFTGENNDFYLALPLSQLDDLLSTHQIPYFKNVPVIEQINSKLPSGIDWEEIVENLKKNHLFHESCHGIARSFLPESKNLSARHQILFRLIEESFANSCELLAVVDAEDRAHRIFFELNSYIVMFNAKSDLKRTISKIGLKPVTRFIILSYICSNFLQPELSEKQFDRLLKFVCTDRQSKKMMTLDVSQRKSLRAISKIAFQLNPQFREVTTGFFLRLAGFQGTLEDMLNFDFLTDIESDLQFQNYIDDLTLIIISSLEQKSNLLGDH
ncbi:MAG: hypothetical protein ACK5P5_06470 [Pseudobdellovibrionaceae bacterium]